MQLENYTKEELKEMAKNKGVLDYANLNKPKLIRALNLLDKPEEQALVKKVADAVEITEEEIKKIEAELVALVEPKKPLSSQALGWRDHLRQLNISPKDYLERYPDHKYAAFIKELIANEK